jgi:RNA polymerase sigma factor (sigma-70 family)
MTADHDSHAAAVSACLERLAAGEIAARDRILELFATRLRALASRMLDRYPTVRRWDDTDDVFQNAALRLHRALGTLQPQTPRDVMTLAAAQVRRTLLDLARRYAGPQSHAAHHATNLVAADLDPDAASFHTDRSAAPDESLDRWSQFHAAIDELPAESREMFLLVWYLGADQKTIARLLDCSARTVKTRWRAARDAVTAALDGQRPE